jgi:EpsI family protein
MAQEKGAGMKRIDTRLLSVVLLVLACGFFLRSRAQAESLPPRVPVASFPTEIGEWKGRAVQIEDDVLEILGRGEFASRLYTSPSGEFMDFFLAYFPSQRTGETIHSPKNCLPGAGWAPEESSRTLLKFPNGIEYPVNRYVIARGNEKQLVFYWYQAHGRAVASEYWAKYYLVRDAIAMNRSDGALVRLVTPVGANETVDQAEQRARRFAAQVLPKLPSYIPE